MTLDILPTAQSAAGYDFGGGVAVVIDVLRATSVITVALGNGATGVVPASTVEDALAIAARMGRGNVVLGGERHADLIPGFDLGNSPQAYTRGRVGGKTVVLTTTNGTLALRNAADANIVIVASMLNYRAAARLAHSQGVEAKTAIVCSGNYGLPTLEDNLCAALMAKELETVADVAYASDHAISVRMMAEAYSPDGTEWFRQARHYNRLIEKGYGDDIEVCLRHVGTSDCVGVMEGGTVRPRASYPSEK